MTAEFSFGGDEMLREVGRIALNFLAQWRPEVARHEALRGLKDYVCGQPIPDGSAHFVWHQPCRASGRRPFEFGHQILLAVVDGAVRGLVRIFDAFEFGVHFGDAPEVPTGAIAYDVDPLADHAPVDLLVTENPEQPAWQPRPQEDGAERLAKSYYEQAHALYGKVTDRQFVLGTAALLRDLNMTKTLPLEGRHDRIAALLHPERVRILHLIQRVGELCGASTEGDLGGILGSYVKTSLLPSKMGRDGLSDEGNALLDAAVPALARALGERLDEAELDVEALREHLAGSSGIGAVTRALEPFFVEAVMAAHA